MDPREKVLREYFHNLVLEKGGSRVEKVNLFPHADHLFLDMERVIQLGELNKKYRDHYVSIDDFTTRLLEGKFSVGSGMSLRLKELNERVERLTEEFEAKAKMEEDIIEEDIANLQEIVIERIQKYFETLKLRLQNMYHEQNAELRESLIEARKTLKDELLNVINTQEFFDKNKFFVEFEALKKQPLELERFLKDYLNNEKTINFQKNMDEQIRKLSPVFHQGFQLDEMLSNYVMFVEKLEPKSPNDSQDAGASLDRFGDSLVLNIDNQFKRLKHFSKASNLRVDSNLEPRSAEKQDAKKTIGSEAKNQPKEPKSPLGSKSGASKTGPPSVTHRPGATKKGNEIALIRFKTQQDLEFDYLKFADCSITQASLELHGTNFNQKSAELMGRFLSSVARIDRLHLNLSISAVTKEGVEPLVVGLRNIAPSLQTLELDLSRSKVETEAFELIAETLQGLHALKSLAVSVENMKITPRNVVNLASCLAGHDRLEELHLNLNFNELDSEDIKVITETLENLKLKGLEITFKGCGLPRNAFKKLCIWLQLAVEISEKLALDFAFNHLEQKDYQDLSTALETFGDLNELKLSFDSNEMGDECFQTVLKAVTALDSLEKLVLNVSKNGLSVDQMTDFSKSLESLGMLQILELEAKRNIKKIEDREFIRSELNRLLLSSKRIDL